MNFGKVKYPGEVDFSLPAIHPDTLGILKKSLGTNALKFFLGCGKWGRKEWAGKIYPEGASEKDFLQYYSESFNSVELNATHYRVPSPSALKKWKKAVPKDFIFCPKFPKSITHLKKLNGSAEETANFIKRMEEFGNKLGPVFLQLPPGFSVKLSERLIAYLKSLPKGLKVFVEFRHPSWFNGNNIAEETYKTLTELKVGTVITDTAGRRDVLHLRLSTPSAFIRFVGNNLHYTDFDRIDDWAKTCKTLAQKAIHEIYFFVHQVDEAYTPELADYAAQEFNSKLNLNLPEIVFEGEFAHKT